MQKRIWPAVVFAVMVAASAFGQSLVWHWSNPQPHGNDVVGMAWNGTLGVQVCELGRVYTSANLIDWYSQTSHLTNDLQAVTFFGKRIVITGANGAVAYSDDGVNFTASSLNTANWLVSVAASPTLAVTVGDNGALYTSSDGATWHLQSPPPDLYGSWLTGVAYGNGVFVTVGDDGNVTGGSYIATSTDGVHWTDQSNNTGNESLLLGLGNLEAVVWINSSGSTTNFPYKGFWAVDDAGNVIYSTNNGVNWNQFSLVASTNVLYTIAADNLTGLIAGDTEVRLGTSVSNHIVWPPQTYGVTNVVPSWTYFTALKDIDGAYDLAGDDGMLVQSSATNGTYIWSEPYLAVRDWLWQVMVTNGLYVAVGDNARIMTSSDGADWTVEAMHFTNSISLSNTVFFCVGGGTNLFLAAGTQGSLALSPNSLIPVLDTNANGSLITNYISSLGVAWYPQPAPAGTTNDLAGMCTYSNNFYIVGGGGTLLSSPDGTNWTKLNSGTTNYLSGIAESTNGLLVLTGNEGTILTSPNGINWTSQSSGTTNWLYRTRCVMGHLLTLGENGTMLTSPNGTNWTAIATSVTNWLNDAVVVSNTCYVVGNQGVVLASTNLTIWTNIGTITTKSLYGAATQNGQLVVVGFEGTIVRSQIVPVMTPVDIIEFSESGGYDVFSVAGTVDQQFTLDSSTNLVNWVTGPLLNLYYGDGTLIFYETEPTNLPATYYRCTIVP